MFKNKIKNSGNQNSNQGAELGGWGGFSLPSFGDSFSGKFLKVSFSLFTIAPHERFASAHPDHNFKILTPSLGCYSMHHWIIRMQFIFLLNHHFKWSVENTCIIFKRISYWRKYYALLIRALLDNFLAIVYSSMLLDVIFHLLLFLTLTQNSL